MANCYDTASRPCSGSCRPGAKALRDYILSLPMFEAAWDGGCYVCRSVRGGSAPSVHGNGRAIDIMFPGVAHPQGKKLALELVRVAKNSPYLGIQFVIWNRKKYGCAYGWVEQPYGGTNPHTDHVHVELTRTAAETLTVQDLKREWGATQAPVEDDMAEGSTWTNIDRLQKNYMYRLNPLPVSARWWINISARDNAKAYVCFVLDNGDPVYFYPLDFTAPGGTPSYEVTIGPGDDWSDHVVAVLVYQESGDDPVTVTGYWRRS